MLGRGRSIDTIIIDDPPMPNLVYNHDPLVGRYPPEYLQNLRHAANVTVMEYATDREMFNMEYKETNAHDHPYRTATLTWQSKWISAQWKFILPYEELVTEHLAISDYIRSICNVIHKVYRKPLFALRDAGFTSQEAQIAMGAASKRQDAEADRLTKEVLQSYKTIAKRDRQKEAAEQRARELLVSNLSAAQKEEYKQNTGYDQQFTVTAPGYGEFIIKHYHSYNIICKASFKDGICVGDRFCAKPAESLLPLYDIVLSQKLMLEREPEAFFKVANKASALSALNAELLEFINIHPIPMPRLRYPKEHHIREYLRHG